MYYMDKRSGIARQLATIKNRDQVIRDAYNVHGLTKQEIHDLSGVARTTINRILKEKPMNRTYTLIASNGQEADGIPTWGYTDEDGAFVDQVHYYDGDAPADAVARFQEQGKLPSGEVTVERGERLDDYWIHEDHQRAYTVTIDPA